MMERWGGFTIGFGLMLAPLVVGYDSAGAVIRDVAVGLLVCIASLAALEWPRARLAMAVPAIWLVHSGRSGGSDGAAAGAELAAGGLILVLLLWPMARRTRRPAPPFSRPSGRAGVRA